MQTKEFCVYNETRENFLSPKVTVIDTKSDPLKAVKVLIEGLGPNAETGLWLNPSRVFPPSLALRLTIWSIWTRIAASCKA